MNKILKSFPVLKTIQFNIPYHDSEGASEFLKGLNFGDCYHLRQVKVQGNFTDTIGFQNRTYQKKYDLDFGFTVDVLEIAFTPEEKIHMINNFL